MRVALWLINSSGGTYLVILRDKNIFLLGMDGLALLKWCRHANLREDQDCSDRGGVEQRNNSPIGCGLLLALDIAQTITTNVLKILETFIGQDASLRLRLSCFSVNTPNITSSLKTN